MNCPSRTDEDFLLNPGWNQSPPRFSPDLTTREDFNGMANAREIGDAERWALRNQSADNLQIAQLSLNAPYDSSDGASLGAKHPHRGVCTIHWQKNVKVNLSF